ncbi:Uncharacterised protein [Corynebacterium striatum]|nr:Uncharacterised protein [Corynebacterium striatum]
MALTYFALRRATRRRPRVPTFGVSAASGFCLLSWRPCLFLGLSCAFRRLPCPILGRLPGDDLTHSTLATTADYLSFLCRRFLCFHLLGCSLWSLNCGVANCPAATARTLCCRFGLSSALCSASLPRSGAQPAVGSPAAAGGDPNASCHGCDAYDAGRPRTQLRLPRRSARTSALGLLDALVRALRRRPRPRERFAPSFSRCSFS